MQSTTEEQFALQNDHKQTTLMHSMEQIFLNKLRPGVKDNMDALALWGCIISV